MITLFGIIGLLLVVGFVLVLITGIITIAPVLLVIILLPIVDVVLFKLLFKRRKKGE